MSRTATAVIQVKRRRLSRWERGEGGGKPRRRRHDDGYGDDVRYAASVVQRGSSTRAECPLYERTTGSGWGDEGAAHDTDTATLGAGVIVRGAAMDAMLEARECRI